MQQAKRGDITINNRSKAEEVDGACARGEARRGSRAQMGNKIHIEGGGGRSGRRGNNGEQQRSPAPPLVSSTSGRGKIEVLPNLSCITA